jgi:hypothetical protein
VTVRKYQPEDFAQIKEWASDWGSVYDEGQFPVHGFIVDGIAAYFLYQTDSTVCWLENMISKRGIDEKTRNQALELLTDAILKEAADLGFTVAYATTNVVSVAKRAKENGAMVKPNQILLIKDLTYRTQ